LTRKKPVWRALTFTHLPSPATRCRKSVHEACKTTDKAFRGCACVCTEGGQLGWERDTLDLLSTTAFPQAVVQRLGGVLAGQQGQRNPPDGVELQCCLYERVKPPPPQSSVGVGHQEKKRSA
jgi:hypothetical protein